MVRADRSPRCIGMIMGVVLAGFALSGCLGGGASNAFAVNGRVAPVSERGVRPHLAGTTLTGEQLDIQSWRGNVVVVNVWGSWCAPCRAEAPDLARAAAATAPEGVRFVGIDINDNPPAARAFEASFQIEYPSLIDNGGSLGVQFGSLQTRAVPYTYVLDTEGRVAARFIGRISYAPLMQTIEQVRTGRIPTE